MGSLTIASIGQCNLIKNVFPKQPLYGWVGFVFVSPNALKGHTQTT